VKAGWLGLVAIAACGSHPAPHAISNTAPSPETIDAAPPAAIVWSIDCAPSTVAMASRASVMITIHATNTTSAVRDPERDPLEFTVDGVSSMELSMAFGNGGRDAAWEAIPPGATEVDQREGMEIAASPGDHVIVMSHAGRELARTTLHITR